MAVDKSKLVFTVEEVAEILGMHPESIRRWIQRGKLKAAKTGKQYLISRVDLQVFWKNLGGIRLFVDD